MTPNLSEHSVQFKSVFDNEISCVEAARKKREITAGDRPVKDSLVGLAFSGGGIRSATFNLGILQALAKRRILHQFDYLSTVSGGGYIGGWLAALTKRFIESGAGSSYGDLEAALKPEHYTPDHRVERSFLHWLRLNSNYLTPHKRLFSGDTWAMIASWVRNTFLNQAILLFFFASVFLLCNALLLVLVPPAGSSMLSDHPTLLKACFVAVVLAGLFMGLNIMKWDAQRPVLPSWLEMPATIVLPLVASLLLNAVMWHVRGQSAAAQIWLYWGFGGAAYYFLPGLLAGFVVWIAGKAKRRRDVQQSNAKTLLGPEAKSFPSLLIYSAIAGFAGGCAVKAWGCLLNLLPDTTLARWIAGVLGTGVVMEILFHAGILRQGLTGKAVNDFVRERWARVGGYITLTTCGWILFASACAFGPLLVRWSMAKGIAGASGLLVWIVGTLTGLKAAKSSKITGEELKNLASAVLQPEKKPGFFEKLRSPRVLNAVAKTAPYIFAAGLLLLLATAVHIGAGRVYHPGDTTDLWLRQLPNPSYETYWRIVDSPSETASHQAQTQSTQSQAASHQAQTVSTQPQGGSPQDQAVSPQAQAGWLALFGLIFSAAACLLSLRVDINEFSMHHFYRNRLVRCFLGASNSTRKEDPFTGFDVTDDPRLEDFADGYQGPYPILNAALNITSGKELGYETRRAKSFVFTPCYCGYEKNNPGRSKEWFLPRNSSGTEPTVGKETYLATFAPTSQGRTKGLFGGDHPEKKITLGTAMAISGAAVSPNMGYHTSTATALLMTLFDVRLGWWMGNPRKPKKWSSPGPRLGLGHLFSELLGQADEESGYVYLSDGGHFENLGVYELIRRKCKLIVACDAGCDEDYRFDDLRALIEKARVDFGARIVIDFDRIRPPDGKQTTARNFAVGKIYYDPRNAHDHGTLIYVKASLPEQDAHQFRTEASLPDDVWRYVEKHPAFPHESTADQWFDEWQFESYRALGEHIGDTARDAIEHGINEVLGPELEGPARLWEAWLRLADAAQYSIVGQF